MTAAVIVLGSLAGCPAAHDGFPDKSCMLTSDCYQGEVCFNKVCQAPPDLAAPGQPQPDLAPAPSVDGGGDL